MFGLDAWVFALLLAVALIPVVRGAWNGYNQGKPVSVQKKGGRLCLVCNYEGRMKTWLGNYNAPQFVALLGLLILIVPGLIFIALAWGKYKCPACGAVGKSRPAVVGEG